MRTALLSETTHAILAISGHENPPLRHIVGHEGVGAVKEKLKTVSEELEEYVGVSCAVDVHELGQEVDGDEEDGEGGEGQKAEEGEEDVEMGVKGEDDADLEERT